MVSVKATPPGNKKSPDLSAEQAGWKKEAAKLAAIDFACEADARRDMETLMGQIPSSPSPCRQLSCPQSTTAWTDFWMFSYPFQDRLLMEKKFFLCLSVPSRPPQLRTVTFTPCRRRIYTVEFV